MPMTVHTVRLPDVGEGIAEAELVSWFVAVGDQVTSDTVIAEVLTDKATVEIYAPIAGTIAFLRGDPGDVLAVGGDFVGIETGDTTAIVEANEPGAGPEAGSEPSGDAKPPAVTEPTIVDIAEPVGVPAAEAAAPTPMPEVKRAHDASATAAPAVRERARTLGIDIAEVAPSNPDGRITHEDLDRHLVRESPSSSTALADRPQKSASAAPAPSTQIPFIGLRRKIAAKMSASLRIPHITYVDEIDMTALEHLRRSLAVTYTEQPRVTVLPFVMRAIVMAVAEQPHLNATFDDEAQPEVLTTHTAVHIGIATQTSTGLIVPVVRNAQSLDLWRAAAELTRVTAAARGGTASRDELSGSTITITSLGALGGLVTTPIINHPEVAIVGINKMQTRPMWDGTSFVPRMMMNMSSSFDHRVIDGFDAATFIQRIKTLLEEPSLLFVPAQ
jgi:2-oxoisovalerate dehydrogenase E2 component (dihydrolipoyl transacylase)